ncbi:hypothetical protein Salat_0076000 [Sesamum alatum]|uniref:Uncharacterized protein n=1 Tax=Sesamum alatum TaxID=300844 RepID=A0AAE2CWQ1_9LAMI|nr:hypothetical protein Salat_0076000 [Sesamum alatum]
MEGGSSYNYLKRFIQNVKNYISSNVAGTRHLRSPFEPWTDLHSWPPTSSSAVLRSWIPHVTPGAFVVLSSFDDFVLWPNHELRLERALYAAEMAQLPLTPG